MFRRTLRRLKPPPPGGEFSINLENFGMQANNWNTPQRYTQPNGNPLQSFSFSEKTEKFAARLNIGPPFVLRLVPSQNFTDFPMRVSISPRHTFSFYHLKFLGPFDHPLMEKMMHFYAQEKKSKPLWCYVHSFSATDGSKAVVRLTAERTVRAALFKALNAAGYDSSGRSLDGSRKDIRGSIRVTLSEPKAIIKLDFKVLVGYMSQLLADIIPRLDNPSSTRFRGSSQSKDRTTSFNPAQQAWQKRTTGAGRQTQTIQSPLTRGHRLTFKPFSA